MMKRICMRAIFTLLVTGISMAGARAELPLVNLDGVGGAALNPVAYLSNPNKEGEEPFSGQPWVGKPAAALWYVALSEINGDWTSIAFAETLWNRLEVGYAYQTFATDAIAGLPLPTIQKNNFSVKLLLLSEECEDLMWVPAVSIGVIYRKVQDATVFTGASEDNGFDFYVVATKTIKDLLPMPLVLSGGLKSTEARTLGFFGFEDDRDEVFFFDTNIFLSPYVAAGLSYTEGPDFSKSGAGDQDLWEYHLIWMANENISVTAAYVDSGSHKDIFNTANRGLGTGFCFSMNYDF